MKRNLRKQLTELLKELHLPMFREYHAEYAVKAMSEGLSYEQYLHELAQVECDVRRANKIVRQLLRAKRDLELDKLLKKLSRFDALMIDDFGYVKQDRDEMEVLFTLLAHRYERGSMLITSNLPFSKWEVIFKDPMTTAAAIDRLVHHSVVLELNVPSYRAEQAKKKKKPDK